MDYLDTSLLVAALTNESRTREIQDWLAGREPEQLAVSHWVVAEFSAALSIKLRTGRIGVANRADALAMFNRLVEESFSLLHIGGAHFRTAARFADHHQQGLRAGDALHLAVAFDHGDALFTLDRQLAEAGTALGVKAELL